MNTRNAIRKGLIPVANPGEYGATAAGFTRFKARTGVYSGIGQYYHDSHDLSGLGDYWNQYTDWWSQQNRLVQIAVPSLFLLAAVKAYPHAKKAVKKVLK